ncbi:MAG: thioredoxin [Planctomycetota bacterium]
MAKKFTDANFQQDVLNSDQPVLVDFWAPWCGPCRAVGPTIDELAEQYDGQVTVGKLNIDENPESTAALGISSIPAVVLFKNGKAVQTIVGVQPKAAYEEVIAAA